MSETPRLAAIVTVDVIGYSRLMGEDETGTARAANAIANVGFPPNLDVQPAGDRPAATTVERHETDQPGEAHPDPVTTPS
jgi:hypothetical protein